MRFFLALILAALLSAADDAPASAQSGCTPTGGYPWVLGSCLSAGDLNKIVALNAGTLPPHNANNQGALFGTLWLDTSATPYSMRLCRANPCSAGYNPSQWALWGTVDAASGLIMFNQSLRPTTRRIDTGSLDVPTGFDNIILWYSSALVQKTESLPPCNRTNQGQGLTVVDGANTAATYNIVIQPIAGNTVGGHVNYAITINGGSVGFTCNGISDWGVVSANSQPSTVPFSAIISRPTTLAGYGITDAIPAGSLGTMATQNAGSVAITGGTIAGATITGAAISGGTVTGLPTPVNPSDAAIKSYVDSAAIQAAVLPTLLVDTATGTATITTGVLEWIPTTPASAVRTLPANPVLNETHIVADKLAIGSNFTLTISPNTGQQILVAGTAQLAYVLYRPSTAVFRYIGTISGTSTWVVE